MMLIEFNSNTMGVTSGVEADYPSSAPEFTPDFSIVRVAYLFSFLCYYVFLRSEFRVVMFVSISTLKQCSVRLCLLLFVGGGMFICAVCVCLRIALSFLTAPSEFYNVYLIFGLLST